MIPCRTRSGLLTAATWWRFAHILGDSYEPARVYDTESWKLRHDIDCGADMFSAAAHPDGKHVLFGLSNERGISYWNVESGEKVREMPIACKQIKGLAIDAAGKLALSGDNSGTPWLVSPPSGLLDLDTDFPDLKAWG